MSAPSSDPPCEAPRPLRDGRAGEPAARSKRPAEPIASDLLFAGASEVQIVHRGTLYRLKQTALGKLILTK